MLTHVVLFILSDPDAAAGLAAEMRKMDGQIPSLRSLEVGVEALPSRRSAHLALVARFDDLDGLEAYQHHPVHQAVLAEVRAAGASTVKVDFMAADG